uniref:DNA-directed RNA polymerase subunit alpha n=1 Tax=Coleochaete scutata TaxID=3125 RepID=A0A191T5Q4_COLSC|nr:alpha subunit of RNA polymerase [Coleochaete scutata]ANI25707.1 alpha subunit of RNA polymerase [Coleochaete scutata]
MIQNTSNLRDLKPQWRCLEYKIEHKRLHYGRFIISPLSVGQAVTVGLALRRILLSEIESICITSAKFNNIIHEYLTPLGFNESIHDILLNFKEIILQGDCLDNQIATISVCGPKKITTADLVLPPSIKIIDNEQHLINLTKAICLDIELTIEKGRGYKIKNDCPSVKGLFTVDAVFMPVKNVNYSIHVFDDDNITREMLILEIWTNGSLTPHEALKEASHKLLNIFSPFLYPEYTEKVQTTKFKISNISSIIDKTYSEDTKDKVSKDNLFKQVFIDQLELPARAYNSLKKVNVNTVYDLTQYSYDDLLKIKNFGKRSAQRVMESLKIRFGLEL